MNAFSLPVTTKYINCGRDSIIAGWSSSPFEREDTIYFKRKVSNILKVMETYTAGPSTCKEAYPLGDFKYRQICAIPYNKDQTTSWVTAFKIFAIVFLRERCIIIIYNRVLLFIL